MMRVLLLRGGDRRIATAARVCCGNISGGISRAIVIKLNEFGLKCSHQLIQTANKQTRKRRTIREWNHLWEERTDCCCFIESQMSRYVRLLFLGFLRVVLYIYFQVCEEKSGPFYSRWSSNETLKLGKKSNILLLRLLIWDKIASIFSPDFKPVKNRLIFPAYMHCYGLMMRESKHPHSFPSSPRFISWCFMSKGHLNTASDLSAAVWRCGREKYLARPLLEVGRSSGESREESGE